MLVKEIVYAVLDNLKQRSDDSFINEDHILFAAAAVRAMLLEQKYKSGIKADITDANMQTACLDLELYKPFDNDCSPVFLKSIQRVPKMIPTRTPIVDTADLTSAQVTFVSPQRFKFVGYNKFLKNIIYCSILPDKYLYFKSKNPQHLMLSKVYLTGIFYDFRHINDCLEGTCDNMDAEFPLQADLIPALLDTLNKYFTSSLFKPVDYKNNAADDISTLARFLATNLKSDVQKQMTN